MRTSHGIKTTISVLLTVIMVLGMVPIMPTVHAAGDTWNPSGGVYDISTEDDLFAFKDSLWEAIVNQTYYSGITVELKADIELTKDWDTLPVTQDAEFRGIFKGNNHVISNVNCISQDNYC